MNASHTDCDGTPSGCKSILLVDDDPLIRKLLRAMLETEPYSVFEAGDGLEAKKALQIRSFSLVITDLVMPDCEGIELIGEILKSYPATKVIAMSGAIFSGDYLNIAEQLGAHGTLSKPINQHRLLTMIHALLGGDDVPSTSRSPLAEFDSDPSIVYAVDAGLGIVYHNAAWDQFAIDNGGPEIAGGSQIGRSVLDVTPDALKPFYAAAFQRALLNNRPWEHLYECSSPDIRRTFQMRALPLDRNTLAIVNSKVAEAPVAESNLSDKGEYVGRGGIVTMCCHCRRTLRQNSAGRIWDWVREFIATPPSRCSHGLCLTCFAYHYKAESGGLLAQNP